MLTTILYLVFALAAIVLITVILLQEGQGGGFTDALGAAGKQTFGVKAKGIQTFTAWTVVVFLISAVLVTKLNDRTAGSSVLENPEFSAPVDAGTTGDSQ